MDGHLECPDCRVSLAPPPQEHGEGCLVGELFTRLGRKDLEVTRLRAGIERVAQINDLCGAKLAAAIQELRDL